MLKFCFQNFWKPELISSWLYCLHSVCTTSILLPRAAQSTGEMTKAACLGSDNQTVTFSQSHLQVQCMVVHCSTGDRQTVINFNQCLVLPMLLWILAWIRHVPRSRSLLSSERSMGDTIGQTLPLDQRSGHSAAVLVLFLCFVIALPQAVFSFPNSSKFSKFSITSKLHRNIKYSK